MSQLNEFNQNNLLFKRFQGQIQTLIVSPNTYAGESGAKTLKNVYNSTIFSSDVSSDISQNYTCFNLDAGPINSGNPNVPNVADTSANSYTTGVYGNIDIVDTTNLRFYKKVFLKSVSSTPYSWWLIDPSGANPTTENNLLKDMIPFAYNDLDLAMFTPIVYYYTGTVPPGPGDEDDPNNWTSVEQQQPPLYWLIDYESGVLQLYAELDGTGKITGTEIITPSTNPPNAYQVPRISFIKYVGEKGAAGGGGGGDASGNLDLSGNLSVGGDADISGNLTVVGDASFCNVLVNCDLDVSGNTDMSGNLTVVKDASFNDNINVTNDAIVRNTNLIQTFEGVFNPNILPPDTSKVFRLALVTKTTAISSGYFTIQLSTPDYLQTINFIAGIIENKTPFIKILSNINQNFLQGIDNISIGEDSTAVDTNYYLTFRFITISTSAPSVDYMKITLVNNHNNYNASPLIEGNWELQNPPQETPLGFTYNYLVSADLDLNGGNAYGLSTQVEYFLDDIVMGASGNIVANDGTGTIDICGNLYVDRDASFNQSVHIRDTLDVSNNANIQNDLTVGGKIIGDLDISGNLDVSGSITTVGNTTLVEYKHYDNTDFLTTNSNTTPDLLLENWCTIAYSNASNKSRSSGLFQIIDKTDGVDQLMWFIVTKNEGGKNSYSINVISNSWSPDSQNTPPTVLANPPFIRKIKIVETGSGSTNKFYIQLDRVAYAASAPTDVDIRLYNNTYGINEGSDATTPWILDSTPPTSPSDVLTINLKEGVLDPASSTSVSTTKTNVVTNAFNYIIGGAKIGNTLDMSNNNINNVNQLKGNNNTINFNNSGNLKLNAQNKLEFGTNTSTNDISYNNNILDFQSTNKIENLSNINETGGDITIGNSSNNVSLNANDININSSNDTSITSTNDININFANSKTMFIDSSYTLGGYQPVEYSENKLNLRTTDLEVKTITNTTKDYLINPTVEIDICGNVYEFTKTELDFNNKNIQNVSELNTNASSDLTVGNNSSNVIFDCDVSLNSTLNVNTINANTISSNSVNATTITGTTITDGIATISNGNGTNFNNIETDKLNVNGMFSFTNDATNAVGLSNFESAEGSTIYKRVSTFNHVFTDGSSYTIRIPNALLFPNQTGFTKGGAAVKIKLTSMGLSTAGSVVGGIEYREYVVLFCPGGTSSGTATSSRHLFVNENQAPPGGGSFATFIASTSVSTSNLSITGNPIVVNNNMNLGLTVNPVTSLLPPTVSNNRCIIRGTIEVV